MEDTNKIPRHVSIIMDGNGRWAQARGLDRVQGHIAGVESVRACTEAAGEAHIPYLSLFAFSEENWNRPKEEVDTLMELMVKSMQDECPRLMKNGVRFVVLGHRSRLSDSLNKSIDELMEATRDNANLTLIVFLSYSGKWDILQAAAALAEKMRSDPSLSADDVTPEMFGELLVTSGIPDPDLIIRTSGELRLSNYLLWQGAYSELYFTDVLWPDFGKEEFHRAISEYSRRDRRYGKVK